MLLISYVILAICSTVFTKEPFIVFLVFSFIKMVLMLWLEGATTLPADYMIDEYMYPFAVTVLAICVSYYVIAVNGKYEKLLVVSYSDNVMTIRITGWAFILPFFYVAFLEWLWSVVTIPRVFVGIGSCTMFFTFLLILYFTTWIRFKDVLFLMRLGFDPSDVRATGTDLEKYGAIIKTFTLCIAAYFVWGMHYSHFKNDPGLLLRSYMIGSLVVVLFTLFARCFFPGNRDIKHQ